MTPLRVGVIFGGANSEHEVSRASAASIVQHLDRSRFVPELIGIDRRGRWHRVSEVTDLDEAGGERMPRLDDLDVAFPALHGRHGEDGSVQGLLELAGVPYVGCGVLASAAAMDKEFAARVLEQAGVAVVPTRRVSDPERAAATAEALGFPVFVKPNRAGSSVGASVVRDGLSLDLAVRTALAQDSNALLQPLQTGREVDLGVLQHPDGRVEVGPPLVVNTGESAAFFDFASKYTPGAVHFEVPAQLAPTVSDRLAHSARLAFAALGCDGLARVDFFVDGDEFVLNEVNTMPGLTALSQFPRIWGAAGLSYRELLTVLLERALVAPR